MGPEFGIGIVALLVAVYGLTAALLARYSISAAFAFVVIGVLLGGSSLGMTTTSLPDRSTLGRLAEITLALVLFSAASTVNLRNLEDDARPVLRLLAIGLPLTIVAGTLLALGLFPGVTLGLALLIGTALAPTDADLGQPVITDRAVPARVRRLLNVESGLNDGIAAPVITVAIALAVSGDLAGSTPVADAVVGLAEAALIGIAIGGIGGWLLISADRAGSTTSGARKLSVLALAIAAYYLAVSVGGSGFIAAFFAGLGFGVGSRYKAENAVVFTEAQSILLSLIVWLVFGLIVVTEHLLESPDPVVIAYALLSVTIVRMAPVALALMGDHFDRGTVLFIGWFGPRGLASIVFALLGLESLESAGVDTGPLGAVVAWTVLISVVLHGFTARPFAKWYGRHAERLPDDGPEFLDSREPRRKGTLWTIHDHDVDQAAAPPSEAT